jgi:hypothetical protein
MGKPTSEQLSHALEVAAKMRESGHDDDFVAKSLLSLNYRFDIAVHVIDLLKFFLYSGRGATEHAKLVKAIQEFEKAQHPEGQSFGLD